MLHPAEVCFAQAGPQPHVASASRKSDAAVPGIWDFSRGAGVDFFFQHSDAMRALHGQIRQAAGTTAPVLIEGEEGAGQNFVAQGLHVYSARRHQPLVKVNCGAVPAEVLESELFGHERGAFNGAHRHKPGKFELAHEGTLLLDGVGDVPSGLQGRLLQTLQDGKFVPAGGAQEVRADVRIIAATNRPLAQAVASGTFRADLYYRLSAVRLTVPPLRARREEIPILAEHFLRMYAARYNRPVRGLAPETLAAFLTYGWPGNVRELENLAKRIVLLGDEAAVMAKLQGRAVQAPPNGGGLNLKAAVRRATGEVERVLIAEALQRTRWNRVEAARMLGISTKALRYKIQAYEL